MAVICPNSFTSYNLTESETREGSKLFTAQAQVLQNHIAQTAEELLALEFEPDKPEKFIQEQAYKKGYLAALQYQLELSQSLYELEKLERTDPDAL